MMTRSQYAQAMAPIEERVALNFFQWKELKGKEWEYKRFVDERTSDSAYEFAIEWAGLAGATITPENQVTTFSDPIQGGTAIATHVEYRTGTEVSNLMAADDKVGIVRQLPEMHQQSHKFTREQVIWNTITTNGFATTTGCDGAYVYASHPLLGGTAATSLLPLPSSVVTTAGYYPNYFATALAPSVTAIQKMMVIMHRQPNGQGIPVKNKVTTIVHPAEQLTQWLTILGSGYDPNSGNNAVNPITNFKLNLFEGTYLTSATNWWAFGEKDDMKMVLFLREDITDEYFDEPKVRGIAIQVSQRFSVMVPYPYAKFGSNA